MIPYYNSSILNLSLNKSHGCVYRHRSSVSCIIRKHSYIIYRSSFDSISYTNLVLMKSDLIYSSVIVNLFETNAKTNKF